MKINVKKSIIFALSALSKKTSDEVVDALAIEALNFYKATLEKSAKNDCQISFSKKKIILGLPYYASLKFSTSRWDLNNEDRGYIYVSMPLVHGAIAINMEARASDAITRTIEEELLKVQEGVNDEV